MFQSAVDRFGGSVAGAGSVEVGQYVGGAVLQRPAERGDLAELSGQIRHLPRNCLS